MQDFLQITALRVSARIGIHEWEQRILQPLLIDLRIPLDTLGIHDDIGRTIDYSALCQTVITYIESHSFRLIETLANELATLIHTRFQINELTLAVAKPTAIPQASQVSITIHRIFESSV